MTKLAFRAWTGATLVYDLAITSEGIPLRQISPSQPSDPLIFVPEPEWEVTRWTGFADRNGRRIYGKDVLEVGEEQGPKRFGAVYFGRGRFAVRFSPGGDSEDDRALSIYCRPAYVTMIVVVGSCYEARWAHLAGDVEAGGMMFPNDVVDGPAPYG